MKKEITRVLNKIKTGIITLPLILCGCNYESFDKGEIYEKVYEPAQHYESYGLVEGVLLTHKEYDDEDYIIKIRKWDDKNKIYHTLNLEISKEQYDTLNVRDTFRLSVPIKYPSSLFNIPLY
jgi:hypothetical protein